MSDAAPPVGLGAELDQVFADLAANKPEAEIIGQLRGLELGCNTPNRDRARFLNARGLVMNRMGQRSESLGDLLESASSLRRLATPQAPRKSCARLRSFIPGAAMRVKSALVLLRAISEASDDRINLALSFFEAGRLELEIGRPLDARRFFQRGLDIGGDAPLALERDRARVGALQALVAARDVGGAEAAAAALNVEDLATARLKHLARIELARLALAQNNFDDADATLANVRAGLPVDPETRSRPWNMRMLPRKTFSRGKLMQRHKRSSPASSRVMPTTICPGARSPRACSTVRFWMRSKSQRIRTALWRRRSAARSRPICPGPRRCGARAALRRAGRSQNVWLPGLSPAPAGLSATERFVRRRPLGAGGFGAVSRAYDLELGTEVALKKPSAQGTL